MSNLLKSKVFKSIITLSAGAVLSAAAAPTVANSVDASETDSNIENIENSEESTEAITFTNEEFFEAFEDAGYNLEDYLTEEEIAEALAADSQGTVDPDEISPQINPFDGTNQIVDRSDGGYDIYIHGSIASLAAGAGVGAVTAAFMKIAPIAAFFTAKGISSGAVSGALGVLSSLTFSELAQGVIVTVNSNFVPQGVTTQ